MKTIKILSAYLVLNLTLLISFVHATSYTWTGTTSTAFNTGTNWSPNGTPGSGDNITIVTHTNLPLLDQNRTVTNITMTSGTFDLNTFTLSATGTSSFNGGTITNGTLQPNGTSTFAGTTIDVTLTISAGKVLLNGSTFNYAVTITDTSSAHHYGTGGNTFNSTVSLTHASSCGTGQWAIDNTSGNTFNGNAVFIQHATGTFFVSGIGTAYFNGNVTVGSDNKDINLGGTSGGITYLASGKTISIDGTTGFSNGTLLLRDFVQQGSTSQSFTLTGTAILNMIGSTFNGAITFSAPSVIFKTSTFNASASLTQTGTTTTSSDGGNTFNAAATITNSGGNGLKMGMTTDDVFNDDVTMTSSSGNEIQPAHSTTLHAKGNVTLNSFVHFNHGVYSMLRLTGTRSQTLTSSSNTLYDLKIDKDSNNVTLSGTVNVYDTLRLVKGLIVSTSSNLINLNSTAAVSGASKNSFVSGPVSKAGNTAFIYPIGKSNIYRALEMSAPSGTTTQVFTGEYFNSGQSHGTSMDTSIKYISTCDYWNLARSNSTATPTVKLSYDSTSCGQLDSATLKVANWNGTKWKDLGNGGITGNRYVGKVANSATVVTYGNFALSYNKCFLTANAGTDQAICTSDSVSIGASPTAVMGTGTYTYAWTPTTALSSSTTSNPKASPSSTTNYVITVTDVIGCSVKDTITVTYHARPTASAGSDQSYCTGDSATIGGSPTASGGSSPYTYSWSPSTGLSSSMAANPKTSPASTTSYIVTVTDNYGCAKQDTVAVTNNTVTYTWTGATSTAWSTASNWSPSGVPGSCDNVIIVTGSNNVSVNANTSVRMFTINSGVLTISSSYILSITGKAVFNSGTIKTGRMDVTNTDSATFNGTTIKSDINITAKCILLNGSTFYNVSRFYQTGSGNTYSSGGNTFLSTLDLQNTGSGNFYLANSNPDAYNGSSSFSTSGNGTIYPGYTKNSTFKGNVSIYYSTFPSNGPVRFGLNGGKVIFNDAKNDTISATLSSGSADTLMTFKKLQVNQSSGGVVLNKQISVTDSLILTKGNITSTSTNLLIMNAGSVVTGASDSGFVNGPVQKIGASAFEFPVGKGNIYRSVSITAPSVSTDAFTAEFFNTGQSLGSSTDTTLNFISDCAYWSLNRSGSSDITPKFSFQSNACDYIDVKPVHIAYWNGTKWIDKGEAVTDGNNRKTSTAVSAYGNFALAYKLIPGDVPQMPYALTVNTSCSETDLLFGSRDIWLSFHSDSLTTNFSFNKHNYTKTYAPIENVSVYDAYQPNVNLVSVQSWDFTCDSILNVDSVLQANLDVTKNYLLKVSRYQAGDCDGIKDTASYVDLCIMKSGRAIGVLAMVPITSNNCVDLENALNSATSPTIIILQPAGGVMNCDFHDVTFPLTVKSGVMLLGDYDLLSEAVDVGGGSTLQTSPDGTLITANNRVHVDVAEVLDQGYMFLMLSNSTIRNIRLRGAMPGFQDFNQDDYLCGGIRTNAGGTTPPAYTIRHCEIYDFSYAGIFAIANSDEVHMEHCYIHHVRGGGGNFTKAKGYGIWMQGANPNPLPNDFFINNCIIDDSKEAIAGNGNPANWDINQCTIGQLFHNEALVHHGVNHIYPHPATSINNCEYFPSHNSTCTTAGEPINMPYNIGAIATGNVSIHNSIIHQNANNITLFYPVGIDNTTLYQIKIYENTFSRSEDAPGQQCNYGGFARINDNYINECVWGYEKTHTPVSGTVSDPDPAAIVYETGNTFSYVPGTIVGAGSPQPPEFTLTVSGQDGNTTPTDDYTDGIPFIDPGDQITAIIGHSIHDLAAITRFNPDNGDPVSGTGQGNTSGSNFFYQDEFVSDPSPSTITKDYTYNNSVQGSALPGLYGIDAMVVDGVTNPLPADNATYMASAWKHQPLIIVPDSNYILTFNIKDSYYNDLYALTAGFSPVLHVKKSVELNGTCIWQEEISEGGDGWEYVKLNFLLTDIPGQPGVKIKTLLHSEVEDTLTFSITIDYNEEVSTEFLRGLIVWVDDVYLKKYNSADNILAQGDVEFSSGLSTAPSTTCSWYQYPSLLSDVAGSGCVSIARVEDPDLDDGAYPDGTPLDVSATGILPKLTITTWDRKSGIKSLQLQLPGFLSQGTCTSYTAGTGKPVLSAAINFDVRDLIGCDDYATMITPAFTSAISGSIAATLTNDAIETHTNENLILDHDIYIAGDIINGHMATLVLNGCRVVVKPDSPYKIILENKFSELDMNGINSGNDKIINHIFACGDVMWGGIENHHGGAIRIAGIADGYSYHKDKIEDAETAISSDRGVVQCGNAFFDHNYTAINFYNSGTYLVNPNSNINASIFECTGGAILKSPHVGDIPAEHVRIENETGFQFPFGVGGGNIFSDALKGIVVHNSSVKIFDTEFSNIYNKDGQYNSTYYGSAIYAYNDAGVTGTDVVIGASGLDNTFTNVNIGVRAYNISSLCSLTVAHNTFNNSGYSLGAGTNFYNTAINFTNPLSFAPAVAKVYGNTITYCRIGIHAKNVRNIKIGTDANNDPDPNNIHFHLGETPDAAIHYEGIWLQKCKAAHITGGYDPASPVPNIDNDLAATGTTLFKGIDIENSLNCRINCNYISNLPYSMRFYHKCDGTILRKNRMDEYDEAVHLSAAELPEQKQINNSTLDEEPANNEWHDAGSSSRVDGNTFNGSPFRWFYDLNNTNELIPSPSNNQVTTPKPDPAASVSCNDYSSRQGRDEQFGKVVDDSLEFSDNVNEKTYQAKMDAYLAMKEDSTLLYQNTDRDTVYRNFFDAISLSNIALFDSVLTLAADTALIDDAIALNSSINDTNDIEYYLKTVYDIYLNTVAKKIPMDDADSSLCDEISSLSIYTAGDAIYIAAAMIGKEIHPDEVAMRKANPVPESKKDVLPLSAFNVIPNPASTFFTVKGDIGNVKSILLIGSDNKQVKQFAQPLSSEFFIGDITPGMYYVKIIQSDDKITFMKLSIIR
jgi:hypothetical protein